MSAVAARVRSSWRIGCAFLRMDAIEDFSYPMSVVFQQVSRVLPVIVYFFVARLFTRSGGAEASAVGDYYAFAVVASAPPRCCRWRCPASARSSSTPRIEAPWRRC